MTLIISIIAIIVSMISLAFSFYQYKNNQLVQKLEKSNAVLKHSYNLRKLSQDLRNKVNITDDIDDYNSLLDIFDESLENQLSAILNNVDVSLSDVFKIETALLSLDLEFDLLVKQINESIRFNEEVAEFEN